MTVAPRSPKEILSSAANALDEAIAEGFGRPKAERRKDLFALVVTDQDLRDTTHDLFHEGHYALSVEEAYKFVNNKVKARSGSTRDGADLMRYVFSVNNPRLKLSDLKTQSKKDQQQGYMDIFAGCMTGIRNPRAHEHRYLDEAAVAIELLTLANHLVRMVDKSTRSRKRGAKKSSSSP